MYLYFPMLPDTYPELVLAEARRRIARQERDHARRVERRARHRPLMSLRRRRAADYAPAEEGR